jgi:hypothetical protein
LAFAFVSTDRAAASTKSRHVKPQLTVCVHIKDGCVVDASLAPASRAFLEHIASELPNGRRGSSVPVITDFAEISNDSSTVSHPVASTQETSLLAPEDDVETIEVPLVFDNRFFEILQSDVSNIDALQAEEQKTMSKEIVELGKEVSRVAKPTRFSSSDLTRWRHIFELYLDAEVFFATHEQSHGARTSKDALRQLQWFQSEVEKRDLVKSFKLPESQVAFARFLKLNLSLLKNLQFQELNKLAVMKILKSMSKQCSYHPLLVCILIRLSASSRIRQANMFRYIQKFSNRYTIPGINQWQYRQRRVRTIIPRVAAHRSANQRLSLPSLLRYCVFAGAVGLPACILHPLHSEDAKAQGETMSTLPGQCRHECLSWYILFTLLQCKVSTN